MSSSDVELQENKRDKLRSAAMKGKWSEVIEMYKQERDIRTVAITATRDNVLHMAVSSGDAKVVADIVDFVCAERDVVLRAYNDRNNTPLHLAASMGNVEMCRKIGDADPSLVTRCNIAGETPLFLAALYGNKTAFLWLHYLYIESPEVSSTDFSHYMRNNGDTILHCAIAEGHFDVAIEIVHLYKNLVKEMMMRRNKVGLTPLHLLAATPSAFKSTCLHGRSILVCLIYGFFRVEEKKQATMKEEVEQCERKSRVKFYQEIGFYQIRKMKEKHTWCLQIMNELLQHASDEDMSKIISRIPSEHLSISLEKEEDNESESMATPVPGTIIIETPLMIAAKTGVKEMVEKILELFPTRIKDVNDEGKNIVLLAADYRQIEVFRILCKQKRLTESIFRQVDKEGNNALHLAAMLGVKLDSLYHGETLSMLREIKWFEFVKNSMPPGLSERYNRKMETPDDIFRHSHKELMRSEREWLNQTSQACSVVSTLVLSVAFAIRSNVPGGYDGSNNKGFAILRNNKVFKWFEVCSSGALFFSLISTICFLSIVASRSQSVNSCRYVPFIRLHFGMLFMFISIVYLWISFCAGDFFMLDDDTLHKALPSYVVVSSVTILLVVTQLPTFLGPTLASISPIQAPRRKTTHPIEYRRAKEKENNIDLNSQD
ncbi:uncharacterized protein LOC129313661 isoform X2 [Prosopis cineraria]|nr:uncharacterized protein LOC129313661 isoform X2 [Prosopis cineraria]